MWPVKRFTNQQHVVMITLHLLMSFLSYSGGRQKQKATPADQNRRCQQQHHLMPYKDLTPLVTLANCHLTLLRTAAYQQTSWKSTPVLLPRIPIATTMRMCHVRKGRAALWPMTSMRPAEPRAGRLVGWKMRSMDNTVDAAISGLCECLSTSYQLENITQLDGGTQCSHSLSSCTA